MMRSRSYGRAFPWHCECMHADLTKLVLQKTQELVYKMAISIHKILRSHLPNVWCCLLSLLREIKLTLCSSGNQLLSKHVASQVPVALNDCRLWYTWRIIASQVMLTSVEATLIIRGECLSRHALSVDWPSLSSHIVYALYNRSKKIAAVLMFLVSCEMTLCAFNSFMNIPIMEFDPACQTVLALKPVIQFGFVQAASSF